MLTIHNKRDLKSAYWVLSEITKAAADYGVNASEKIKEIKRDIRRFQNEPISEERIVKDDGIDGFISLSPLPEYIRTKEDAEEHFNECCFISLPNSPYDCTGRAFTGWYHIFQRGGCFWAYHRVCFDV